MTTSRVSDKDFAAIVKRYEDAGDQANADIIRKQWEVARAGDESALSTMADKPGDLADSMSTNSTADVACSSCGLTMVESRTLYDIKQGALVLAQAQDEAATVGVVDIAALKASVKDIAARLNGEIVDQYTGAQEDGDAEDWRNYCAGKLSGLFDLEHGLFAWLDAQNVQAKQEQFKSAGAAPTCRVSEKVQAPQDDRHLIVVGGQRLNKSSLLDLQHDAARYRWLRDKADDMVGTAAPMVASLDDGARLIGLIDGDELDAAVDVAMARPAARKRKTK